LEVASGAVKGVKIRSLTVHAVVGGWDDPDEIARVLNTATRWALEARRVFEDSGLEVWTVRVALPPLPRRASVDVLVEGLKKARLDADVLYAVYHRDAYSASASEVRRVLSISENLYASVSAPEPSTEAARVLYEAARLGADMASRFSLTVPDHVETPYFPAASTLSSTPGISIALLYPQLLRGRSWDEALIDLLDYVSRVEDAAAKAADRLGLDFYGIDLSLSPWMEDSVTGVLEEALGDRLGSLGTMSVIASAEDLIAEACEETICTGYNQVMLPVAEDNILKERVAEGAITLRELAAYSYACVAGVDLPLVPSSAWSERMAFNIVSELYAASYRKGMPLAARIISVDAEPGSWIELPRFGRTPVIKV
jgi:uncharacterized protein (UPF0210 family)